MDSDRRVQLVGFGVVSSILNEDEESTLELRGVLQKHFILLHRHSTGLKFSNDVVGFFIGNVHFSFSRLRLNFDNLSFCNKFESKTFRNTESIGLADLTDVKVFTLIARIAISLDGSHSASITAVTFMDNFCRDGTVMDEAVDVFLKVALGRMSSINDLSGLVNKNQVGDSITLIISDSSAFILSNMVVFNVEPVFFCEMFLSSFLAFIQVKSNNLYFVLPEIFV